MSHSTVSLPLRARLLRHPSLLALGIATVGVSLHFAALYCPRGGDPAAERGARMTCGAEHHGEGLRTGGLIAPLADQIGPSEADLHAIEARCVAAGGFPCDVAAALPLETAVALADARFGTGASDSALLRFAPEFGRLVWTVRDHETGARVELDAIDGRPIEYAIVGPE